SGEIIVDGLDISRLSERDRTLFRRRNIGLVFQFFNLIPTLNVWENLMLPLELNGLSNAVGRSRVSDLLESVGLSDRARSFPDRLSGGEQQRIAIARALVHEPKLLLADEPTGNLDGETGRAVMDTLVSLVGRNGGTMLVVTHSREVVELADRVLGLQGGTLVDLRKDSALELADGKGL
ncbi:MAG: ATP-binding cassette domain-containing protein, partial [Chloroflexi bacterium]|nr:ATP-binding cassette domain-containing protein [Chloroflexota bacterium]